MVVKKTNNKGVYYREHPTRKNGVRKDRYFIIRYTLNGKQRGEGFGWESEGYTESKAFIALNEIKENIKNGKGFFSLKEKAEYALREKDAEEKAIAAEKEKNITFAELWDTVYLPIYLNHKIPKTQANEKIDYEKYIKPVLGHRKIKDITPANIEKIKEIMKNKAPATINHALAVVRQVFNAGRRSGKFTGNNPASEVKKLKKDNRRIRFLSKEEARDLLEALSHCETTNLHDITLLGLYCGMRAGEIFSLQWLDINLHTRKIIIRDPKGIENRMANMNTVVFDMLKRRAAVEHCAADLVFTKRNGGKIQEVSNQFQRIVDRLGFNDGVTDRRLKVVFHTLRHTFISWLAMAGIDAVTIKELAGHSDLKMTERYMHLAPDKFTTAIAVLDEPLPPKADTNTKP